MHTRYSRPVKSTPPSANRIPSALSLCTALACALTLGCSADPEPIDDDAATSLATSTPFTHPATLGYVWWSFPNEGPLRELELCFSLPANAPATDGLRLVLAQGHLWETHEGADAPVPFSLELHSQPSGRGCGLFLTRGDTTDLKAARAAGGGWVEPTEQGVRVGNSIDWTGGDYVARLAWRRANQTGAWYGATLQHVASGDLFDAGELRFGPQATLKPRIGTWAELTSGSTLAEQLALCELFFEPPRIGKHLAHSATTSYGELPNVDLHLDARNGRARLRFGASTPLRHGAGHFDLSRIPQSPRR